MLRMILSALGLRKRRPPASDPAVEVEEEPIVAPAPADPASEPEPDALVNARDKVAKYQIGQVVKHRLFPFRGVIFDVDPEFANTEEWYASIPEEVRPARNQPYYHLFAENDKTHYVAYVSEQNLLPDDNATPVSHPDIPEVFEVTDSGQYRLRPGVAN